MTFILEVFEIIQEVITLKNNKTKRRLKAKISENLESETRDSVVPSYYFSVLTAMMDIEVPDEDIDRVQILIRPICRKYTIQNIPTYLADLFLENDVLEGTSSQELKEKLTYMFSKKDLVAEETQEICDYCCTAMEIIASDMGISYDKDSFEEKVSSIIFNAINCEETENDSDEDQDDSDEESLQVLETGNMIDMENGKVFDIFEDDEDYTDEEDYTDSDEDLYEELEEKQMEINNLRKQIVTLREENQCLHNSINKIELIYTENQKRLEEQRGSKANLILFGIVFGSMYIFGPAYFYMKTKTDMTSMFI